MHVRHLRCTCVRESASLPPCTLPSCRLLLRAHKQALYATRHFWKQLLHHDVSFQCLARAFRNIEETKTKADRTYKMVLDRWAKGFAKSFAKGHDGL